jgi:hypothetical protein
MPGAAPGPALLACRRVGASAFVSTHAPSFDAGKGRAGCLSAPPALLSSLGTCTAPCFPKAALQAAVRAACYFAAVRSHSPSSVRRLRPVQPSAQQRVSGRGGTLTESAGRKRCC